MTVLGPGDPLPHRPRRVLVDGSSGAGKTTLARTLAARWGLPCHELDALHHGPGWTVRPEFVDDVTALAATSAWVTEWQYTAVRPLLLRRADLVVWLALPRRVVFGRLARRTLLRRVRRTPLWNGNVEAPLWTVLTDPDHIVRYAWRAYPRTAERMRGVIPDPVAPVVVALRSPRDVTAWLAGPVAAVTAEPDGR